MACYGTGELALFRKYLPVLTEKAWRDAVCLGCQYCEAETGGSLEFTGQPSQPNQ